MFEFGSDLANLNEKIKVVSQDMFELLWNCAKSEISTISIAREFTDMRQNIMLMDERVTEMNDRMTELEQERNKLFSHPTSFTPSYAARKHLYQI